MKLRTGVPLTSHGLLDGLRYGRPAPGDYRRARASEHPLKKYLRNSRQRKAPITLPTTPFDHRGETS